MFRERHRLTISVITYYLMTVTFLRKITVRITMSTFLIFCVHRCFQSAAISRSSSSILNSKKAGPFQNNVTFHYGVLFLHVALTSSANS